MNTEIDKHYDNTTDLSAPRRVYRSLTRWWGDGVAQMQHWFARAVAWTATRAWQVTADWRAVRPLISRASAHLAILALALGAMLISGLNLPARDLSASTAQVQLEAAVLGADAAGAAVKRASIASKTLANASPSSGSAGAASLPLNGNVQWSDNNATIVRLAQPHTEFPVRPRRGVITHTVAPGESVQSIADLYGLEPTTLLWSNTKLEELPDLLRIGQKVVVLPVDGAYHTVVEDDTLESIAEKYEVEAEAIANLSFNDLRAPLFRIQVGMKLIIPGGTKPYVPRRVTSYSGPIPTTARGTGAFVWPVSGSITQWHWWGHRAIDIGAPTGSAVLASDGGYVSFAGWTDVGYGYLIILDHANGYSSYYAHLSQMYVAVGQQVSRGQVIGGVGSTGNSSGPHLHLEIRYNGVEQNPVVYLP